MWGLLETGSTTNTMVIRDVNRMAKTTILKTKPNAMMLLVLMTVLSRFMMYRTLTRVSNSMKMKRCVRTILILSSLVNTHASKRPMHNNRAAYTIKVKTLGYFMMGPLLFDVLYSTVLVLHTYVLSRKLLSWGLLVRYFTGYKIIPLSRESAALLLGRLIHEITDPHTCTCTCTCVRDREQS